MTSLTLPVAATARRLRHRAPALRAVAWLTVPLLVLALIAFYPLALVAYTAFTGKSDYYGHGFGVAFVHVLSSGQFLTALLNTVQIAVLSTAGCLVLGFVLALVVSFVPFPGSGLVARFVDTVLAFPSFLIALSFAFLYGRAGLVSGVLDAISGTHASLLDFAYTKWGVILAEVTFYTPFVMRPLLAGFAGIDTSLIEVASSLGARPWRLVRKIIFPEVTPALLAGGGLCLVLTLNEFGIVLFMGAKGVTTLPLLIYNEALNLFDYTAACAVAMVNVALSLGLYSLYRMLLARAGGTHAAVV